VSFVEGNDSIEFDVTARGIFQVADILEVGLVVVDEELRIQQWNAWLENASGMRSEEVIGRSICDVFPQISGSPKEAMFRRAVAGETIVMAHRFHEHLLPVRCPQGITQFDCMQQSARLVPLRSTSGVTGAMALIQDVTERVAREDELRAARDAAEKASRAKSEFLASMSHELRTPLTAVIGYADLMVQQIGGPILPLHQQHAQRIKSSAWHLIGLIDEVLTFSRAEAGREELLIETADICAAARMAMTLVEPQAAAKGVSVSLNSDCETLEFDTDSLRIQQILVNLLGNAVKFTDEGSVSMVIGMEGADLVVRVIDTGPGVPEDRRREIFEPFTQADQTATRAKGGTGLGLSVSQKLAELMGGSLILESSSAAGSTFTLRLPPYVAPASRTT
jgi:PAS domain S-box-containing protein